MSHETAPPLSGVRILDLSRILAGPFATQLLADLGAEVIKVERPDGGDDTRGWGPPFVRGADGRPGDAAYFLSANRTKKSICIDITKPAGAELVRELAAKSDVLVENFKVGGLKKYGLDYPSVAAVAPRIVYCSITGFGQTGPLADRAGYDFLIQAMSGLMSVTGQPDGAPGAEPMKTGVAVSDLFTGLYASTAILAALRRAEATGRGDHIDLALLDCQIAALANQTANYLVSGVAPGRLGNAHPNIVPYQVFPAADGHIVVACGADRQFASLSAAIDRPDLAEDARFATNAGRVANRSALVPLLSDIFKRRPPADWIRALEAAGVPCGPIQTIDQALGHPQISSRGLTADIEGTGTLVGSPVRLAEASLAPPAAPPRLDADASEILRDTLGMDGARIEDLRLGGVIGARAGD
ncbi:MAG: CaiB/BaiF CoA-transferase family protein [Pseudomonadota bacterium]